MLAGERDVPIDTFYQGIYRVRLEPRPLCVHFSQAFSSRSLPQEAPFFIRNVTEFIF